MNLTTHRYTTPSQECAELIQWLRNVEATSTRNRPQTFYEIWDSHSYSSKAQSVLRLTSTSTLRLYGAVLRGVRYTISSWAKTVTPPPPFPSIQGRKTYMVRHEGCAVYCYFKSSWREEVKNLLWNETQPLHRKLAELCRGRGLKNSYRRQAAAKKNTCNKNTFLKMETWLRYQGGGNGWRQRTPALQHADRKKSVHTASPTLAWYCNVCNCSVCTNYNEMKRPRNVPG
jgi:hypothetical protein